MKFHFSKYLFSIVLSLFVFVFCGFISLFCYLSWAKSFHKDVHPVIQNSEFIKRLFTNKAFTRLMETISEKETDFFKTIWDFDDTVYLSKTLFQPQEMFGITKYRYLPNIEVANTFLWTGLERIHVIFRLDEEVKTFFQKCDSLYAITYKTDEHGFKVTDFEFAEGDTTVFFLEILLRKDYL